MRPQTITASLVSSELIDPVVNLDFYQITSRGSRMSDDAKEFSSFLKTYIANWAGTSSAQ